MTALLFIPSLAQQGRGAVTCEYEHNLHLIQCVYTLSERVCEDYLYFRGEAAVHHCDCDTNNNNYFVIFHKIIYRRGFNHQMAL